LSELDHNDRVKTVYFCPKCGWESFDDDAYESLCGQSGCDGVLSGIKE